MNFGLILAAIGAGLIALGFMGKKDDDPRITPPQDEPPRDEPPQDEPPRDEPPRDEPPRDEPPRDGPPGRPPGRPPGQPPVEHELVSAATAWPEVDIWAEI